MLHVSIVWSLSWHKSIETNSIQILLFLICIYSSVPIAFWLWSNLMDGPGQNNAFFDEFHPCFRPLPSPAPWRTCCREHQRRHPQLIGLWGQSCTLQQHTLHCLSSSSNATKVGNPMGWFIRPIYGDFGGGLFLALPRESLPPNTKHTPKSNAFWLGIYTIWRPDNGVFNIMGMGLTRETGLPQLLFLLDIISFVSAHEILLDAYDNSHHPQLWLIVVTYRW